MEEDHLEFKLLEGIKRVNLEISVAIQNASDAGEKPHAWDLPSIFGFKLR